MDDAFYYLNPSGQPVGPLALRDLQALVEASLLSASTLVCPAGGADWKPLRDWHTEKVPSAETAAGSPLHPGPLREELAIESTSEPRSRSLMSSWMRMSEFTLSALGFDLLLQIHQYRHPEADLTDALRLAMLVNAALYLAALGFQIWLFYWLWRALPTRLRPWSPGMAAGLLAVPGFGLYWTFRSFPALADAFAQWHRERGLSWTDEPHSRLRRDATRTAILSALSFATSLPYIFGIAPPALDLVLLLVIGLPTSVALILYFWRATDLVLRPSGLDLTNKEKSLLALRLAAVVLIPLLLVATRSDRIFSHSARSPLPHQQP